MTTDLLTQIVSITITRSTLGIKQLGFGVALILSAEAAFVERIRFYADIDAVGVDFATTTATYRMAQALFGQVIQPEQVAIGRSANKPTQKYSIVPVVQNSTTYKLLINGTEVSFTSDASATNDEIVSGLLAAVNALSGVDTLTATNPGGVGVTVLTLTANAPGNYNSVEVANPDLLAITQDHADPGLAADLAEIALENSAWYFILYPYNSKACAVALATYAQANKKVYVADTSDSNNITLAIGADSVTSLMGQFKTSSYSRSAPIYHPNPQAFTAAAWIGRVSPLEPGSETWYDKTLAGPAVSSLTQTHINNLNDKNGNYYVYIGGLGSTVFGKVSSGDYIDTIRFLDWLEARMGEAIAQILHNADKVPFTDGGISVIQGGVQNTLNQGVAVGGLAADPAPLCTVPKASAVTPANKALRKLTGVKFSATLAGAIHTVQIAGNVSV